jgi:hypothetical protein
MKRMLIAAFRPVVDRLIQQALPQVLQPILEYLLGCELRSTTTC